MRSKENDDGCEDLTGSFAIGDICLAVIVLAN